MPDSANLTIDDHEHEQHRCCECSEPYNAWVTGAGAPAHARCNICRLIEVIEGLYEIFKVMAR